MKRKADWYFDFISPFAYLQFRQMERFQNHLDIRFRPVLFAGLLNAWGQLGPAEIPEKRLATYRYCIWLADRMGAPFRMPDVHPFNPLGLLRLAVARGGLQSDLAAMFQAVWGDGRDAGDAAVLAEIEAALGPAPGPVLDAQAAKDALRANTEEAVARGAFGVPTFAVQTDAAQGDGGGHRIFWGLDAGEMLLDWLKDPALFDKAAMKRAETCRVGAERRR